MGGINPPKDFYSHQNIIFSNGLLDPWRSGGVTEFTNMLTPLYTIRDGAHHLDMRAPTKEDIGSDVEWDRKQEASLIESWVRDYQNEPYYKAAPIMQK